MKRATTFLLISALAGFGCDKQEEAAPATEGATEGATAETPPAEPEVDLSAALASIVQRIGGSKVLAGNLVVEVLPQASGEVRAVVSKADGTAVQDAKVTVAVKGTDGASHDVELTWNAEADAFVGTAGADVRLAPGPVRVTVTAEEREGSGEIAALAVAPTPLYGGQTVILGDIAAEVRADAEGTITVVAANAEGALGMESGVAMKATVLGSDGQTHEVELGYDEEANAYIGALADGLSIASGALQLTAVINGTAVMSRVAQVGIAAPTHDGDVVAVGDMTVELVPGADNKLTAFVVDAQGAAVQDGAEINLKLQGRPEPLPLQWDASAGAYVAVVPPDIDISAAPLVVQVRHGGRARHGAIACAAGRRLGVGWRARLAAGAGGAIPPGHAPRLMATADLRGRFQARGAARLEVQGAEIGAPSIMALGMAARVRAEVMAPVVVAPAVQARLQGASMINAPVINAQVAQMQAATVTAMVVGAVPMAPSPPTVSAMVTVNAMASAMAPPPPPPPSGMASASAMASLMIGF